MSSLLKFLKGFSSLDWGCHLFAVVRPNLVRTSFRIHGCSMMGGRELSCTALDDLLAVLRLEKTEKFKFRFLVDYVRHVKKSRVDPFRKEILVPLP